MPDYVVTGKSGNGVRLVSVHIDSIDQEEPVMEEMVVVNAVRAAVAGTAGVAQVVAQRYEQTITIV